MSIRTTITDRMIEDAWRLYLNKWTFNSIAKELNCSEMSIYRCCKAMEMASLGYKVPYSGIWRDSHHIADYANKAFAKEIRNRERSNCNNKESVNKYKNVYKNEISQRFSNNKENKNSLKCELKDSNSNDELIVEVLKNLTNQIAKQNSLIEAFLKKFQN